MNERDWKIVLFINLSTDILFWGGREFIKRNYARHYLRRHKILKYIRTSPFR